MLWAMRKVLSGAAVSLAEMMATVVLRSGWFCCVLLFSARRGPSSYVRGEPHIFCLVGVAYPSDSVFGVFPLSSVSLETNDALDFKIEFIGTVSFFFFIHGVWAISVGRVRWDVVLDIGLVG